MHWREARTTAFNRRKVILVLLAMALSLVLIVSPLFNSTTEASGWVLQSSGTSSALYGIWGDSSPDMYACGDNGTILHFDGSLWEPIPTGIGNVLYGIWGRSPENLFVVGNAGTILHYDGNSWDSKTSGTRNHLNGVWGASSGQVFAVGAKGTILQYEDGFWTSLSSGVSVTLYGVWGSSSEDVYAVGNGGTVLHYDGLSWSSITSNTTSNLWGVWGSTANDVFAVGNGGCIVHYDGNSWTQMSTGVIENLYSVWGGSSSEVFAAGANGMILRYDGSSWTQTTTATSQSLRGIWGRSATELFAVGDSGTILRYSEFVPVVTSVSPTHVDQGDALAVVIEGENFNEVTGISFGEGVFVEDFLIENPTRIYADITIAADAVTGSRDITVTNSYGTGFFAAAITIPHAQLDFVLPGSGYQGQSFEVIISGTNLGGATAISFGAGIDVTGLYVNGPTQMSANITVAGTATVGLRDVTVATPGSTAYLGAGFAVHSANHPPFAVDDSYITDEDQPMEVEAPGILNNDSDSDSDILTAVLINEPSNGTLELNADGSFTYTPHPDFHGEDSFAYQAYDGQAYSDTATVTIMVTAVNDPPVATDDTYMAKQGQTLDMPAPGVLSNDSDPEGDALNAILITDASCGTLTLRSDGSFVYMPDDGFLGTDFFTYRATDGIALSNPATVTLTIRPKNNPPVAPGDTYATIEDNELHVGPPGVLGNDSDMDGDPLTAVLVSTVTHGELCLNLDGSFTYLPDSNFAGTDSFIYRAFDGQLYSEAATVVILVDKARPIVLSVDPNRGIPGQSLVITVRGANLTGTTDLNMGTGITVISFSVESDEIITAEIVIDEASATGARGITLTTPAGTDMLAWGFTVITGPPAVSGVYPTSAARGETLDVLVNGSNLTGVTAVNFGQGVTINSFSMVNPSRMAVNIEVDGDAAAGPRVLYVTAAGGTATLDDGFEVTIPPPVVTAVVYSPIQRGQTVEVEIHGANLDNVTEINLGDDVTVSTFYLDGSTRIVATVNIADDASEGSRNVTVTAPQGSATLPGGFNVKWAIEPSSLWLWLGVGLILAMLLLFFAVTRNKKVKRRSLLDP